MKEGPVAEGDGAVAAGGGEAVPVPEQDAKVGARVVRRRDEAAVHAGVAAGLVAQQSAELVEGVARGRCDVGASLGDRARGREVAGREFMHDPEWFAGRVPVFYLYPIRGFSWAVHGGEYGVLGAE